MKRICLSLVVSAAGALAAPAGEPGRALPPAQNVPIFNDDACFVQGNDDDVPDLVVWAGNWSDARLLAVDGKTGRGLWASDPIPHLADTYMFCADPATVVVGVSDFTVRAFEAASGRERWRATVSDQPHEAAAGSGCLLVLTKDEKKVGLTLATGALRPCVAGEPRNYRDRARGPESVEVAGTKITLETRAKGTPMLSLVGSRGKRPLWETPLGVAKALGAPRLAVIDKGVYANGVDVADHASVLLDVDTASGRLIWKKTLESGINLVLANRSRLYVGTYDGLRLLDPATGEEIWQATPPAPRK